MGAYRCVLLGLTREVETIEEIDALTKRGALKIARATLQRSPALWAFELWRGKKLLYRETQTPPIEGESPADQETPPKVELAGRLLNGRPRFLEQDEPISISGAQPIFW